MATRRHPAETPLMRQFLQIKEQHPDGILFFRMGDFYEMFFEDAVVAAKELDLTLTSRDRHKEDAIPMAGVPHHAARGYVARLTELGHKVIICEQTEDPKKAKGLVKREVVQVVTPGIVIDGEALTPKEGRYLAAVVQAGSGSSLGLAFLDVSTGEFRATELTHEGELFAECARVPPGELLLSPGPLSRDQVLSRYPGLMVTTTQVPTEPLVDVKQLVGEHAQIDAFALALAAASLAADYAQRTQPGGQLPLSRLRLYSRCDSLRLDETAVANLELVQTLMGASPEGSLLKVVDGTETAPGGRMLRHWLLYPLIEVQAINARLDAVEFFVREASVRADVRAHLKGCCDVERIAGRISLGNASPRDLGNLRAALRTVPRLVERLAQTGAGAPKLAIIDSDLLSVGASLAHELERALVDVTPAQAKDGGFVRAGFCPVVDEQRSLASGAKEAIAAIEARERDRTGIATLKVRYNRVFGYYLEATKSQLARIPEDYVRKQTVANAERFVTPELADIESKILGAQELLQAREMEIFQQLCCRAREDMEKLLEIASWIARVDVMAGLAEVAQQNGYERPVVADDAILDITQGRHPVVERNVQLGRFVPNSCRLDPNEEQLLIVTGPNMAGKSTYMRQVAHIVVMAQMGSFVPAQAAHVGVCDQLFTRVGAADNLSRGESTFMVEMRETATILTSASRRSLVILDEVGRGTSTFDGVSIAWAVAEYLHDAIGARTLFATHYHELTRLAAKRPRIRNISVSVRQKGDEVVFLRQVVPGGASRSYGIDVARLAKLPSSVLARARQILAELENGQESGLGNQLHRFGAGASANECASTLHKSAEIIMERLLGCDPMGITPLQALTMVTELRALAQVGEEQTAMPEVFAVPTAETIKPSSTEAS